MASSAAEAGKATEDAGAARGKAAKVPALSRTELGCLLGAFRDVAFSIGMQVLAVTLRARSEDEATGDSKGETTLPKGRSRRELKLIALVQTFADNVAYEGYILEKIDMKPVEKDDKVAEKKDWKVRVELKSARKNEDVER